MIIKMIILYKENMFNKTIIKTSKNNKIEILD